ncbi:PREDICTED: putative leucine-rich repeat-containing protein DDB_G0290503 [Diuraphis noxia]|uniref:putative leucine-rich repeat-containing protein DDB_G0290503 n=1 Tax=Diuraphis noxia TaxID=143948 RepID=UPI0007638F99|nr:PREDICTED: putative leucine-rich repeat-containing protein DDB_G0290503 [Diuraphis noxia]
MDNQLQSLNCMDKTITLQITSAYGFGLLKGSIVIHATFLNKKNITPEIPINQNVLKITSDIIWYMNNATLKKSKMSNTSIKIECYNVPINKSSSNKMLGYLLLKLKGAQTINPTSNDRIENKSYKLIGSKTGSYHLNLSLRIEDNNVKSVDKFTEKNKNLNPKIKENLKKEEEIKYHDKNVELVLPKSVNIPSEQISLPENDNPQKIFTNIQQKLIEELEDWKDKQMLLFNEKMKTKEEQLLKDFNDKWSDNRKQSEEKLTNAMLKCKELAKDLEKKSDMLKERDTIVTAKELEFTSQKDNMENKYIDLVQNMQFSNTQTINELNNKFSEVEANLHTSEKLNILLRKENEALKYDIDTNCGFQVQELEKKIANLEYKIEEANKSRVFFKERWIASVKKINQMYTKFHETKINKHLFNNKQKIHNVLTDKLEEWQQDKQQIRSLLNDLSKLRQDMTNINYLDF